MTSSNTIKQLDKDYIAQTYGRFDLALSHGKGCEVWDFEAISILILPVALG